MGGMETVDSREEELVLDVIRKRKVFRYAFGDAEKGNSYAWRFERAFCDYLGVPYALAVSSGSAALRCALAGLGVKPGSEVIVPAYTFIATLEAVIEAGARPVLAEIDDSFNLDPADLARKVTARTSAVIPVHMMGAAAAMDEIMALADRHGLPVLEDACQAPGARYRGRFVGTIGRAGTLSFDSAKLITCSEGGMVVTADRYHDHGHVHDLTRPRGLEPKSGAGFNYRLSELLAAFGLAQFEKLPGMIEALRRNRGRVKERLRLPEGFRYRRFNDPEDIATFLCLLAPDRARAEKVKEKLAAAGVSPATLNYWHFQANRELAGGDYPATEALINRAVVLEIKVLMSDEQIGRMADALNGALAVAG